MRSAYRCVVVQDDTIIGMGRNKTNETRNVRDVCRSLRAVAEAAGSMLNADICYLRREHDTRRWWLQTTSWHIQMDRLVLATASCTSRVSPALCALLRFLF